jgi:hypothetical protein
LEGGRVSDRRESHMDEDEGEFMEEDEEIEEF